MSFHNIRARISDSTARTPILHSQHCINRKQHLSTCSACRDVCPKGVFSVSGGELPLWEQCINCGFCSSQCPARCITASPLDVEHYLFSLIESTLPVIACEKSDAHADIEVICLGAIPWEFLAYLSLTHNVALCRANCSACEFRQGMQCFSRTLGKLKQFHGKEAFEERVLLIDELPTDLDGLRISGPVFFGGEKRGQNVAVRTSNALSKRDYNGLIFRNMLYNLINYANAHLLDEPFSCTIDLPSPNESCFGCGICADLCPHNALSVKTDGRNNVIVSITAWKCVACGTCSTVCRRGFMEAPRSTRVSSLGLRQLAAFEGRFCMNCGRPLAPEYDTLCGLCR